MKEREATLPPVAHGETFSAFRHPSLPPGSARQASVLLFSSLLVLSLGPQSLVNIECVK
jgi:hypothetical protein